MPGHPSEYSRSPLELAASLLPVALQQGRLQELMEAVRVFHMKPGEGIILRGKEGIDHLKVMRGRVAVRPKDGAAVMLDGGDPSTSQCMMPAGGVTATVDGDGPALLFHIDQEKFDFLVLWESLSQVMADEPETQRRMAKIQSVKAFRRLPAESVHEAVRRMERVQVCAGQEVIRQGENGDAFFVIDAGQAEVWRAAASSESPELVVTLGEGDSFGEDALVMGRERNATVRMSSDGYLLKLSKADFNQLISAPMIREVTAQVAKAMLDDGYCLLDVRYAEEYDEYHIPGCTLVPLAELRQRTAELDLSAKYIVYCRAGKRSAVATLLLSQLGAEAVSLHGGIIHWPYEIQSNTPEPN